MKILNFYSGLKFLEIFFDFLKYYQGKYWIDKIWYMFLRAFISIIFLLWYYKTKLREKIKKMPLIEVKNLVKKYKITEKEDGLIGCI